MIQKTIATEKTKKVEIIPTPKFPNEYYGVPKKIVSIETEDEDPAPVTIDGNDI